MDKITVLLTSTHKIFTYFIGDFPLNVVKTRAKSQEMLYTNLV